MRLIAGLLFVSLSTGVAHSEAESTLEDRLPSRQAIPGEQVDPAEAKLLPQRHFDDPTAGTYVVEGLPAMGTRSDLKAQAKAFSGRVGRPVEPRIWSEEQGLMERMKALPPVMAAPPANAFNGPVSPEAALEADAAAIAASLGILREDARRRLVVEQRAGQILEDIVANYADRLAGVYMEHVPRSRIVVRLTGDEAVPTQVHRAGAETFEIVFQTRARHTRAEVLALMEREGGTIDRLLPGWNGRYVDDRTGQIVIGVEPRDPAAVAAGARLSEALGVPVRIEEQGPSIVNVGRQ